MESPSTNESLGLPQEFYDYIKPYLEDEAKSLDSPRDLIALWDTAINLKDQYPAQSEKIAEWTLSVGSRSLLIDDNDIFDAIHSAFGSLEVEGEASAPRSAQNWLELGHLMDDLKSELKIKDPSA